MEIRLQKLSPTHHIFTYLRVDGTRESAELETKTYLTHDFLHFALETEARLSSGFYGLLSSGRTFADLRDTMHPEHPVASLETQHIEMVVGVLSGIIKGVPAPQILSRITNLIQARGEELPVWLTEELVEQVAERMRKLIGQWGKLPRSETMVLHFS